MLDSLEIQQFRVFEQLTIERLGRVNLIAGKNDVGKTSLLEALWLYARQGDPAVVWEILRKRDEIGHTSAIGATVAERTHGIKHLFHGRPSVENMSRQIVIGSAHDPERRLWLGVGWYVSHVNEAGERMLDLLPPEKVDTADHPTLRLRMQKGNGPGTSFLFSSDLFRGTPSRLTDCLECVTILGETIDMARMAVLWDAIASSDLLKSFVLRALRIINPDVEDMTIPEDLESRLRPGVHHGTRHPCVQVKGCDEPLPIRSLGKGITRVLGIALALVNARDGFLLVDEVESGLHLSMMADLWRLIFEVARRLKVQVFAATHTWDSIEAFQAAASEYEQYTDAMLLCLKRRPEGIIAERYEGEELATVPREQIEM